MTKKERRKKKQWNWRKYNKKKMLWVQLTPEGERLLREMYDK